jgi:hypothetical protein
MKAFGITGEPRCPFMAMLFSILVTGVLHYQPQGVNHTRYPEKNAEQDIEPKMQTNPHREKGGNRWN